LNLHFNLNLNPPNTARHAPIDIELASYASWPAFEQVDYRGWILRFGGGCTKRANSVNTKTCIVGDLPEAVAYCESFYKARGQPAIFRLLSFIDDPNLDLFLAGAGYDFIDPSLVLCQALDCAAKSTPLPISVDRASWLNVYDAISGVDPVKRAIHAKILALVPAPCLFAVLEHQGEPVACGLGIIHQSWFGIFELVTRTRNRRQGHGTQLVKAMLAWAPNHGARNAYVQVMANNTRAIRLYEKLGYRRLYHYWYRVQRLPKFPP
jgi:N-acetylglutamate synthase